MGIKSNKILRIFYVASSQSGYATQLNQELSYHLFLLVAAGNTAWSETF